MKYEDMSDRQVNKRVAAFLGLKESAVSDMMYGSGLVVYPHNNEVNFDPCENPSDAWPIIVENKIAIDFIDGYGWTANPAFNCSISVSCHDEPLRAAMICFLKMKDA